MQLLETVLFFLMAILITCFIGGMWKLVGGGVDSSLVEEKKLIIEKLIKNNITKKVATKLATNVMNTLINKYENPFIISLKVNNIIDKCGAGDCSSLSALLRCAGMVDEIEQIYIPKTSDDPSSDLYECPRCSAKKSTVSEVMLRSIDEPLVVKCSCQSCGLKFQPET